MESDKSSSISRVNAPDSLTSSCLRLHPTASENSGRAAAAASRRAPPEPVPAAAPLAPPITSPVWTGSSFAKATSVAGHRLGHLGLLAADHREQARWADAAHQPPFGKFAAPHAGE